MSARGFLQYPMNSPQRNVGVAMVRFNTGGGTPTITNDDDDIVSGVANGGAGIYTLTLNQRYTRVRPFANMQDTDPTTQVKCVAGVEGQAAANTVVVYVAIENAVSGISALVDPASEEIDVLVFLRV